MLRDCCHIILSLYKQILCVKNRRQVDSTKDYVRNFKKKMQNEPNQSQLFRIAFSYGVLTDSVLRIA